MLQEILAPYKAMIGGHTELRVQRNLDRVVTLVAGNVMENRSTDVSGVCARVFDGGFWGFASAAEKTGKAIDDALAAAKRNASFLTQKLGRQKPAFAAMPAEQLSSGAVRNDCEQKALLDYTRALDSYIGQKYPKLAARRIVAKADFVEKAVVTSDGADVDALVPRAHVYCILSAEAADGSIVELFDVIGGGGGFFLDLYDDPGWAYGAVDELYAKLMDKRDGVYADAGERDVVLDSKLAGILAHEAIGHTTEADLVLGGSVAGPNLGKEVASGIVTLVDFANAALGEPAPQPVIVDDEGTVARDVTLIEGGVLKAFMHNRETAQHFGHEPLGNARAYLFSDEPLVRMRNTAILPGKDKLADMISSIDDGYYLTDTGNGQADLTSEFMFAVTMGYEIKGGKIGRAIRDTTISGVAFDLLKTVTMLSDEMSWISSGMCGKKQPIAVGMGGPAVKCRVNIGGR